MTNHLTKLDGRMLRRLFSTVPQVSSHCAHASMGSTSGWR